MLPVQRIVDLFGGPSALARALAYPYPSLVQGWIDRGRIPAARQQAVLDAARKLGLDISPADFFLLPDEEAAPAPVVEGNEP